jgi:hypothetical protein
MRELFIAAAGISGALAVGLGAMGAHAFVGKPDDMKEVWKVISHASAASFKNKTSTLHNVDWMSLPLDS